MHINNGKLGAKCRKKGSIKCCKYLICRYILMRVKCCEKRIDLTNKKR